MKYAWLILGLLGLWVVTSADGLAAETGAAADPGKASSKETPKPSGSSNHRVGGGLTLLPDGRTIQDGSDQDINFSGGFFGEWDWMFHPNIAFGTDLLLLTHNDPAYGAGRPHGLFHVNPYLRFLYAIEGFEYYGKLGFGPGLFVPSQKAPGGAKLGFDLQTVLGLHYQGETWPVGLLIETGSTYAWHDDIGKLYFTFIVGVLYRL